MKSHLTDDFLKCFARLPLRIKKLARENYKLLVDNPYHSSLSFKRTDESVKEIFVYVNSFLFLLGKIEYIPNLEALNLKNHKNSFIMTVRWKASTTGKS